MVSEKVFIAAVNQCTALCEYGTGNQTDYSDAVDTMFDHLKGQPTDLGYKAALKGYVQTGRNDKGRAMFECIQEPDGSDVAAALMSAGGTGDADFADSLWKKCLSSGLIDASSVESTEPLIRHYLASQLNATPPRIARFKTMSSRLASLDLPVSSLSISLFFQIASSVKVVQAVHHTFLNPALSGLDSTPSVGADVEGLAEVSELVAMCIFSYVTRGSPIKALDVYHSALLKGCSCSSMHCGAVESYLVMLHQWEEAKQRGSPSDPQMLASLKQNCEAAFLRAEEEGVTNEWARMVTEALQ